MRARRSKVQLITDNISSFPRNPQKSFVLCQYFSPVFEPNVGNTLNGVPGIRPIAHCAVQKVIKVLVVAVDHVATHIKQKSFWCVLRSCQTSRLGKAINQQPAGLLMLQSTKKSERVVDGDEGICSQKILRKEKKPKISPENSPPRIHFTKTQRKKC